VDAITQGRLRPGDPILFAGFGAGMTWASVVWRWPA
jgi:3-oxoacyl-[acyl-carrier-protein] synthase III